MRRRDFLSCAALAAACTAVPSLAFSQEKKFKTVLKKADIADPFSVVPRLTGIEILGSSSDHTILDVEDCEKDIKVGDIIEFEPNYSAQLYLTLAPDVNIVFK